MTPRNDAALQPEAQTFLAGVFGLEGKNGFAPLAGAVRPQRYAAGDLIVQQGAAFHGVFFVQAGLVCAGKYASNPHKYRLLKVLGPNECFGLDALLGGPLPHHLRFARAYGECRLLFVQTQPLLAFFEQCPRALAWAGRALARELAMQDYRLTRDAYEGDLSNLADLLYATLAPDASPSGKLLLQSHPSTALIASLLGNSEVNVAKRLRELKARGVIAIGAGGIQILDWAALEQLAAATSLNRQTPKSL